MMYLPIVFRVESLSLGQSHDYPIPSEVTLKNMCKTAHYQVTTSINSVPTSYVKLQDPKAST